MILGQLIAFSFHFEIKELIHSATWKSFNK